MLHAELDLAADSMKPQALLATSVRDYIEANLADPQLSPASIAAAHFISTRHLHNVFHESGSTVASWIRSRRLERVRRDLRDPLHSGTSVGAVAARWGFLDAAHFSRTFREAFGESPSDWRRAFRRAFRQSSSSRVQTIRSSPSSGGWRFRPTRRI